DALPRQGHRLGAANRGRQQLRTLAQLVGTAARAVVRGGEASDEGEDAQRDEHFDQGEAALVSRHIVRRRYQCKMRSPHSIVTTAAAERKVPKGICPFQPTGLRASMATPTIAPLT